MGYAGPWWCRWVESVVQKLGYLTAMVVLAAAPVLANTPVIRNSEVTATLLCMRYESDHAEMVPICRAAVSEPGHTDTIDEELYFNLGYAHYEMGEYAAAREAFGKGLAINPQSYRLHEQMGWSFFDENLYAEAKESFRLSSDIHATAYNLSGLASASYYSGDAAEPSITLLESALVLDPHYLWGWRQKGWILYDNGDFAAADAEFEGVLGVDEDDANAHYGRARVAYDLDEMDAALAHVNRAIAIEADIGAHQRLLSMIAYHQDKFSLSIAAGNRALDLAPNDGVAAAYVAFAHDEFGRRAVALDVMRKAELAGAGGIDFRGDFITLLNRDRQWDAALEQSEQVIADERADARDYSQHAHILLHLGQYDAALTAGNTATRLDRGDHGGPHMAARALVSLGRFRDAAEMIVRARENGLDDEEFSDFLGLLVGKGEEVLAAQLRLNPDQFSDRKSARSR